MAESKKPAAKKPASKAAKPAQATKVEVTEYRHVTRLQAWPDAKPAKKGKADAEPEAAPDPEPEAAPDPEPEEPPAAAEA